MTAAWNVVGKPKKTVDEVSASKHLDPEVLQRWVDYLPKDHPYPYLDDWKAMTASSESTEDQAKVLGDAFQKLVVQVHNENAKIEEQNDIVRAKNGVPKHRLLDAKPSEFETFDQFCPGCELELKALPTFEAKLYLDLIRHAIRGYGREVHSRRDVLHRLESDASTWAAMADLHRDAAKTDCGSRKGTERSRLSLRARHVG